MNPSTIGTAWLSELTVGKDPVSGATVSQLTHYRAHSNHAKWDAMPDRSAVTRNKEV